MITSRPKGTTVIQTHLFDLQFRSRGIVPQIALWGDSRHAGAKYNAASDHDRAPQGCISAMLNVALGGRGLVIAPGRAFTESGNSIAAATNTYMGFSLGSRNIDTLQGFLAEAVYAKPDIIIAQAGYNSLSGAGGATNVTKYLRQFWRSVQRAATRAVVFCPTIWGPGAASQADIDSYNAQLRVLIATAANPRIRLIECGDVFTANPALYFTANESPQVHWSVTGAKLYCAYICRAIEGMLAPAGSGPVALDTGCSFTTKIDDGVLFSDQFGSVSSGVPTSWASAVYSRAGADGIDNAGTSASGTKANTATATPAVTSGNVIKLDLLTGAGAYLRASADSAFTGTVTSGDRLAFAIGFRPSGMEAGNSFVTVQCLLRKSAATVATITAAYRYQADAGDWGLGWVVDWGLVYFEITAGSDAIYDGIQWRFDMEQADDVENATAGAYSGTVEIANSTIMNLTRRGTYPR